VTGFEIRNLVWDDANEWHLAGHHIPAREVQELLDVNEWVIDRHPSYPDQVRAIGHSRSGRWLTVVLEQTPWPGTWRPVTGWESTREEIEYWREQNPG
jgi:hypothetical protein